MLLVSSHCQHPLAGEIDRAASALALRTPEGDLLTGLATSCAYIASRSALGSALLGETELLQAQVSVLQSLC